MNSKKWFSAAAKTKDTKIFELERPIETYKCESPRTTVETNKTEALDWYTKMVLWRRLEIEADTLYKARFIRGFLHLYDGQEAVVLGMESSLNFNDSVITAYREHCHQLARGDTPFGVYAELMGRQGGSAKGKGGSMHMYMAENNFYGGNGIVGAQVPLGAGLAFAHKYRKDGGVAVAAYGDGASNQGQIFEAANMAALWKLPLILVCENNKYGMGTSMNRSSASTEYHKRFGYIPGLKVDGMDVLAVKEAYRYAKEHALKEGPIAIEMDTYRYHGHSMADPGISYRTRDEVDEVRQSRDPIMLLEKKILDSGWSTPKELKEITKKQKAFLKKEIEKAKADKEIPEKEMYTEIYRDTPSPFVRAVRLDKSPTDIL